MLPLFKSNYSVGKSILTLDDKEKEGGPSSIIRIAEEQNLPWVFLLEDNFSSFRTAQEKFSKMGVKLIYGVKQDSIQGGEEIGAIAYCASSSKAMRNLMDSINQSVLNGTMPDYDILSELEGVMTFIPFYGSYIEKNFNGHQYSAPVLKKSAMFFTEDNGLPLDTYLRKLVGEEAKLTGGEIVESKTILYKKKEDFKAFQFYRANTNARDGAKIRVDNPNVEGLMSDRFCLEDIL